MLGFLKFDKFAEDDSGASVVLDAVLLLLIAVTFFSAYYPKYAKTRTHLREAEHAEEVGEELVELKSKVERVSTGRSTTISFPGSPDSPPLVPDPNTGGVSSINPITIKSVRINSSKDALLVEDKRENNFGKRDYLLVRSELENNARSLLGFSLENFPFGSRILKARIWVYCDEIEKNLREVTSIRLSSLESDDWIENEATWNNYTYSPKIVDETFVEGAGWISFGVKEILKGEVSKDGRITVSLAAKLENYDGFARYISLTSREEGLRRPYLKIEYHRRAETLVQNGWQTPDNYHEIENVDPGKDLELQYGKHSGRLVSKIFDAGSEVNWDTISWIASTPSIEIENNASENSSVDYEPENLVDDNPREGEKLTALGGAQIEGDGIYERIRENGNVLDSGSTGKNNLWLENWEYRREIQIDHSKVSSDLENFPVAVFLDESNFDFSKARTDGYDMRFTSSSGDLLNERCIIAFLQRLSITSRSR